MVPFEFTHNCNYFGITVDVNAHSRHVSITYMCVCVCVCARETNVSKQKEHQTKQPINRWMAIMMMMMVVVVVVMIQKREHELCKTTKKTTQNLPPKIFGRIKVSDLSLILFPVFVPVIFIVPKCPCILQWVFNLHLGWQLFNTILLLFHVLST